MTNEKIIMNARLALLDAGLIGTTGRQYEIIDENGDSRFVDEPEELHTFVIWQRMGYSVKKGEKAIAKIRIWKYSEKTEELTGKTQQDDKADVEDLVAKAVKAAKRCRLLARRCAVSDIFPRHCNKHRTLTLKAKTFIISIVGFERMSLCLNAL